MLAAFTFAACTQDEWTEQGTALPEGAYPLQIGGISITAKSSEQLQTRVAENETDGMGSHWTGGERIGVCIGDNKTDIGIYVINVDDAGNVTVTPETPVFWQNTYPATVTAWYPVEEEIDFTQQSTKGLTYLLKGTSDANASYNTSATLTFAHQLAKVRVLLTGEKADEVADVTVRSYPKSVNNQGDLGETTGGDPIYVPMLKTEYNGKTCWEATLRPGSFEANNTFEVAKEGGIPVRVTLAKDKIPVTAGEVTTITITVNSVVPDDATVITDNTGNITDNDEYVVRGSGHTTPINITGGSPTIYLDGATVSVGDGNAINITNNATPTIYVVGENNTITSSNGAGIYVAENATVTITGSNRSDVLTVTGNEGSSGIGGYVIDDRSYQSANSGNINIKNVTLYAYSSSQSTMETVSPGIGSTGSATCQSITIDNAAVYAYGCGGTNWSAPAIGNGIDWMENTASATPTVTISNNSEVHAHRGERNGRSFADYIGRAGTSSSPYSDVKASVDATSVVYKYTGYGNTPDQ